MLAGQSVLTVSGHNNAHSIVGLAIQALCIYSLILAMYLLIMAQCVHAELMLTADEYSICCYDKFRLHMFQFSAIINTVQVTMNCYALI